MINWCERKEEEEKNAARDTALSSFYLFIYFILAFNIDGCHRSQHLLYVATVRKYDI